MTTVQINDVGDLYRLFKQCDELQSAVTQAEREYANCSYDPCGYMRGLVTDAEQVRDTFFANEVTIYRHLLP